MDLLLEGQPEPPMGMVFETVLPCVACIEGYTNTDEVSGTGEPPRSLGVRRTGLWENHSLDGLGRHVSPAFNHPKDLEEAALLFYTAYPDRKRWHPQSREFKLQISGSADEDIVASD